MSEAVDSHAHVQNHQAKWSCCAFFTLMEETKAPKGKSVQTQTEHVNSTQKEIELHAVRQENAKH